MKKTTQTTKTKAPTPAKKAAPVEKKKATAALVAKKLRTAATSPAPTVLSTTISALIDVGYGNTLYLRGEGPGLSWEKGLPMTCVADNEWLITLNGVALYAFKFLLNDEVWCTGADYTLAPGKTGAFTPEF